MNLPPAVRDSIINDLSKDPSKQKQNVLQNQQAPIPAHYPFDPNCQECVRELWGPLLSPFAHLLKQTRQTKQNSHPKRKRKRKIRKQRRRVKRPSSIAKIFWLVTAVRILIYYEKKLKFLS